MRVFQFFVVIFLLITSMIVCSDEGKKYGHNVLFGYESAQQYGFIPGNSYEVVEAQCSEGKKVLGGGYSLVSGGAWEIVQLGPTPDGDGYFLEMRSYSPEPQEVIVTAICANVSKFDK